MRAGRFPSSDETYHLADDVAEALGLFGTAPADRRSPGGRGRARSALAAALVGGGLVLLLGRGDDDTASPGGPLASVLAGALSGDGARSRSSRRSVSGSAGTAGAPWSPTGRTSVPLG